MVSWVGGGLFRAWGLSLVGHSSDSPRGDVGEMRCFYVRMRSSYFPRGSVSRTATEPAAILRGAGFKRHTGDENQTPQLHPRPDPLRLCERSQRLRQPANTQSSSDVRSQRRPRFSRWYVGGRQHPQCDFPRQYGLRKNADSKRRVERLLGEVYREV